MLTRRSHIEPRKQRPSSSLLMPLSTWCHSTTKSSFKLIFREAVNCQYGGHGGSLLHAAVAEGDRKSTSMLISAGARFLNYQFKPKLCYFSESYTTQSITNYLPAVRRSQLELPSERIIYKGYMASFTTSVESHP